MKITNQITRYYILFYALYSMTQRIIPISVFCVDSLAGILYKLIIGVGGCLALAYLILGFKHWKMIPFCLTWWLHPGFMHHHPAESPLQFF